VDRHRPHDAAGSGLRLVVPQDSVGLLREIASRQVQDEDHRVVRLGDDGFGAFLRFGGLTLRTAFLEAGQDLLPGPSASLRCLLTATAATGQYEDRDQRGQKAPPHGRNLIQPRSTLLSGRPIFAPEGRQTALARHSEPNNQPSLPSDATTLALTLSVP